MDIRPERRSTADDNAAAFHLSLHRMTSEKGMVFNAPFPEVLSPVTRRKVKLYSVFAMHLTLRHS